MSKTVSTRFLEAHAPRDRARVLHINFSRAPVWEIEKFFETRHSWIFQKISRKSQKSRSAAVSEIFLRLLRFFNLAPRSMPRWAPVPPLCSRTTLPVLPTACKSFRPRGPPFLVFRLGFDLSISGILRKSRFWASLETTGQAKSRSRRCVRKNENFWLDVFLQLNPCVNHA